MQDLDLAEFKGIVITKLDDIKEEIQIIHKRIDKKDDRVASLEKRVTTLETENKTLKWVASTAIALAVAVGTFVLYFK